ncbi:MAG: 50S ribosomal protein L9 [Candidatus Paceibacterota bacterium]
MLVILLENIDKLGNKGEVKNVKDGFARNFLFPRNLAVKATPELLKKAEEDKAKQEEKQKQKEKLALELAKKIEGKRFVIKAKAGDEGQLFSAISSSKIADKIKENGFEVDSKQLILKEAIKKIGDYKIEIKFKKDLKSTINVIIDKEGK